MIVAALAAVWGCGTSPSEQIPVNADGGMPVMDANPADGLNEVQFPPGFLFGTAIAGFQADMGCPKLASPQCDDRNSDWFDFTTARATVSDPNAFLSGQDPTKVGPGFWELYAEDIQRAGQDLHNGALRLSIEWSRIFPKMTDGADTPERMKALANPDAVARYHAIFAELAARGMRPFVTLNHYTLPNWLHDAIGCHTDFANCSPKGWVDSARAVREATKYAAFCAAEFGGEVDWWATVNEPLQNVLFGYLMPQADRSHPPAVVAQADAAKTAFHALIEAHARMYDAIRANDTIDADGDGRASWIGVAYPFVPYEPNDPSSELDRQAAENTSYLWNRVFLEAISHGQYDENLDGTTVLRPDLGGRLDYVGINWYGGTKLSGLEVSPLPALSTKFTANPYSFVQTPNDPSKLAAFLRYVNVDLGLPAIMTENGTAIGSDESVGPPFLVRNLRAVGEALRAGADVRGYFYWTLTDNYEWNHGMDIRMGLFAVDKDDKSKARTPRSAAAVYAQIASSHALSDSLLARYVGGAGD
jgi:beta-glucosidase/6-phospho-beta-glucosidase/beta-galactosidase